MFKGKNFGRWVFFLAVIVCGIVFGFVVNRGVLVKTPCIASLRKPGVETQHLASLQDTNIKTSPRQTLRRIYTSQIGVREMTGKNDGPEAEKYLAYVGIKTPSAWCAAFVSWVYGQAGLDRPKTAWSPALFPAKRVVWGRGKGPVKTMGRDAKSGVSTEPRMGDVFGIYFSELKRIAHCGFVDEWSGIWCITVEGNTNDRGTISNKGDPTNPIRAGPGEGVYRKKRLVKTIYKVADWVTP